jgi:hypothetical protein
MELSMRTTDSTKPLNQLTVDDLEKIAVKLLDKVHQKKEDAGSVVRDSERTQTPSIKPSPFTRFLNAVID